MKRHLPILAVTGLLLTGYQLFAQIGSGVVSYNTTGVPFEKRVFLIYTGDPATSTPLSGAEYQTALYWGPEGTRDMGAMIQVGGAVNFLTGTAAGTFFGGSRTISPLPVNGGVAAFQSRAWRAAPGVTSFEAAVASGTGPAGFGPIFDMKTKDPTNPLEPTPTIGQAAGWRGYALVPEPSIVVLGALAAASLLFLARSRVANKN